jgi:cathepsin L
MKEFLANFGPATVVMWVAESFLSYKSGVYYEDNCPKGSVNHAVAIVGYGVDPRFGDFWWVRNSWGQSWGMAGYAKFARNRNNTCNICNYVMVPF